MNLAAPPFMVMDTDSRSSGIRSERIFKSSTELWRHRLADVAGDALVVGVVAAMAGESEGDRESFFAPPTNCDGRKR